MKGCLARMDQRDFRGEGDRASSYYTRATEIHGADGGRQ
jgi:hypothetical protein